MKSWDDLILFTFITLWIILTAGSPDLIDASVCSIMDNCDEAYERILNEKD
jgi:hypothetical protein